MAQSDFPAVSNTEPELIPAGTEQSFLLSVIVPARNEEDVLAACLQSLLLQSETGFKLGRDWEILLIDDRSTDRTAQLVAEAARTPGVAVIAAPPLDQSPTSGFTGKTNACWAAAQVARGRLLLFTDATRSTTRAACRGPATSSKSTRSPCCPFRPGRSCRVCCNGC